MNAPVLRLLRGVVLNWVVPLVRPVAFLHSVVRGAVYYGFSSKVPAMPIRTILLLLFGLATPLPPSPPRPGPRRCI